MANTATSTDVMMSMRPSFYMTLGVATLYVLSGVTQPLLMEWAKKAGLADPSCQLYMLFYYIGPASVIFTLCHKQKPEEQLQNTSWPILLKTAGIAAIDIMAQTMNYTGSTMAGPTIFAIIYSSVTIWCAVLSRLFLQRQMSYFQWVSVFIVFGGLTITAFQSVDLGQQVLRGALLVIVGSCLHAFMYVLSEGVMNNGPEKVSARKYCAIYGSMACFGYFTWQIVYTSHHYQALVLTPMEQHGTTYGDMTMIYAAITVISLIHSVTFFHTVKYFPGGATSAGVMKALQAVLVFVATSWVFCGKIGGSEMCFTTDKMISLIIVVGGVTMFGKATELMEEEMSQIKKTDRTIIIDYHRNDSVDSNKQAQNEMSALLGTKPTITV